MPSGSEPGTRFWCTPPRVGWAPSWSSWPSRAARGSSARHPRSTMTTARAGGRAGRVRLRAIGGLRAVGAGARPRPPGGDRGRRPGRRPDRDNPVSAGPGRQARLDCRPRCRLARRDRGVGAPRRPRGRPPRRARRGWPAHGHRSPRPSVCNKCPTHSPSPELGTCGASSSSPHNQPDDLRGGFPAAPTPGLPRRRHRHQPGKP